MVRLPFWYPCDRGFSRSTCGTGHSPSLCNLTHVAKDDAVRRVDVERLRLGVRRRSRSRIPRCVAHCQLLKPDSGERERKSTVSDAHSADELAQALCVEQVADHAVALALVEATFRSARDDTACILPAIGGWVKVGIPQSRVGGAGRVQGGEACQRCTDWARSMMGLL